VLFVAGGIAAGWHWWRRDAGATGYADLRLFALNPQLAQVAGPYRLLVGDSHAERLFLPELCGAPVIDAGVGGARAITVRHVAKNLVLPRPPEAIVLMVGTNDLKRSRDRGPGNRREGFRRDLRALIEDLTRMSPQVFATPLPPLDRARAANFDVDEVGPYSRIVAEECARAGCRLADVFPDDAARSPDGIHLGAQDMVGEDGTAARLSRAVCGGT
jgi:lysophospholipase L1-like esterase